jgi:hypothetical protein
MDEMRIKSSFMKAILSTVAEKFLRSKGIEIDISISDLEVVRDDTTKKLKISVNADAECTDDQLSKLIA